MAASKALQLEGERSLAETPVLSFMALLLMPRPRLLELAGQLNALPKPCRELLTRDNLFLETTRMTNMYQRIPGDLAAWMGDDMEEVWRGFLTQSANPGEATGELMYPPAAEPLINGLGEKMITEKYGIEYVLGAGSKVLPVDRDLYCQDVLTIPTGVRDPRKVATAHSWTRPIVDSPLLVFPQRLGKAEVETLGRLTNAFVDAVGSLTEPMRVSICTSGNRSIWIQDSKHPFLYLLKLMGQAGSMIDLDYANSFLGYDTLNVWVDGRETKLSSGVGVKENRYVMLDITNADLVRYIYGVLEERFLSGVKQVQGQAKEAAALMVAQLKERHEENWDRRAEMAVQLLAEIVYGTWVESLLLLWRTKFSNPVAGYLR